MYWKSYPFFKNTALSLWLPTAFSLYEPELISTSSMQPLFNIAPYCAMLCVGVHA